MKFLAAILFVLVAICAGALVVIYSGTYDVGATQHDNALVNWVLDTAMTRSVQRHARGTDVPSVSDSASSDEVELAGRGFTPQVEGQYREKNPNLDFSHVDKIEKTAIDPGELEAFVNEGKLAGGGQ